MSELSRYTQYLPAVLWSEENDPQQFLGRMLRIFEHLLTGIPQAPGVQALVVRAEGTQVQLASNAEAQQFQPGDRITFEGSWERGWVKQVDGATLSLVAPLTGTYAEETLRLHPETSLESTIQKTPHLLNPWQAPPEFLPWLASWFALDFQPDWSEYQQRKFTSEILSIYQQRGLKQGLLTYLDIYAATEERPRIVVDSGEAILRGQWLEDGSTALRTVAYSHVVENQAVLLHPTAIAVDRQNSYWVADRGSDITDHPPALWKISSTGEIPYGSSSTSLPAPQPVYMGEAIANPTAVAMDRKDRPYLLTIGAITRSSNAAIYTLGEAEGEEADTNDQSLIPVIDQNTTPTLPTLRPVDMVLLEEPGTEQPSFVVLDRGNHRGRAIPKLVTVQTEPELTVEEHALNDVVEPTALVIDSDGRFIVADAKEPVRGNVKARPADLYRIDPNNNWTETSLLSALSLSENPLIRPTGLVFESPTSLLVCDSGVRDRSFEDRSNRNMAELPALYRIDLSQSPPQITRITDPRRLVNPSKIALDTRGELAIADQGEFYDIQDEEQEWRAQPDGFGVVVLFSQQRRTTRDRRNRIRFEIANLIDEQKPGHTTWWMKSL